VTHFDRKKTTTVRQAPVARLLFRGQKSFYSHCDRLYAACGALVQTLRAFSVRRTDDLKRSSGWLSGIGEMFVGRHFDREVIVQCVRWYLRFRRSYRDLVEMMAERGLSVVHTTIMR
jgi:hypothetical protein